MPYALHEVLEVHEIANFKNVCLLMSKTMVALVSDKELKQIMLHDVNMSTEHLKELDSILSKVDLQETNKYEQTH